MSLTIEPPGSATDPAARSTSRTRVMAQLRAMIIDGTFAPDENLSEIALAEQFGVSRTPVREALKQLQTEGLVEIRPRVGTFVRQPSRRELVDLFQMKEILEGAAARMLADRGRVPEVDLLLANVERADAVTARGETRGYVPLVEDFHGLIVRGADNGKLAEHYGLLMNQLAYSRLVATSLSRPGRAAQSEAEHRRVLDLIVAKDGEGAERAMREHVRQSRWALLASLDPADGRG